MIDSGSAGRRQDLLGGVGSPLIIVHGSNDAVVSPNESFGYKLVVEKVLEPALAAQSLRFYTIVGVGHNPIVQQSAFLNAAIDALDVGVETGTLPSAWPQARAVRDNGVGLHQSRHAS
jgi:pimeloyl-ACP methyl ester carboxylesterase